MISRQKARRVAYGMVVHILEQDPGAEADPLWSDEERGMVRDELKRILAELKKKSQ